MAIGGVSSGWIFSGGDLGILPPWYTKHMSSKSTFLSTKRVVLAILAVALIIVVCWVVITYRPTKEVNNFQECLDAGGTRQESYPEQCTYEGKTYEDDL